MPSLWQCVRNHFLPNQVQGNNNNYVQMVPINAQAAQLWQRVRNHFFPNQGQGNNNNNVELMPINPQAAPEDLEQGVIYQPGAVDPDPHHHVDNGQPPVRSWQRMLDYALELLFGMTTSTVSWVSTSIAAGALLMLSASTLGMDWDERFGVHNLVHNVAPILGCITLSMVIFARNVGPWPRLDFAVAVLGVICINLLIKIWTAVIPTFSDMMRILEAQPPAPLGC